MWEKTLEEVPVDDDAQSELYHELINWVRADKSFTRGDQSELLEAWRQAVHEF